MAGTVRVIQNAFTSGEITPRLLTRNDLAKYMNAASTLENFLILPFGGITRRPGTRYIWTAPGKCRLVSFVFSALQSYVLEFSNEKLRVYKDGGIIEDSSNPGTPYEIASPYAEADLDELYFCQSVDTLYIAHPDYEPRELSRSAHDDWSFSLHRPDDGPWTSPNTTNTTLAPSATTGSSITITASADLFAVTDVDRLVKIIQGSIEGVARITGYTDAQHVTAKVLVEFNNTGAVSTWRLGAWSNTTGWPGCVSFYGSRLAWARGGDKPQTVWISRDQGFVNHGIEDPANIVASDPMEYALNSDRGDVIQWILPHKRLLIGTAGSEWWMSGANGGVLDATTIPDARRETAHGSAQLAPVILGNIVLFLQRNRRKIHEYAYDWSQDSFTTPEVTLLSEHMTRDDPVKAWAYQQSPWPILWIVLDSGALLALTYQREEMVVGFTRQVLGGGGIVESVCTIPGSDRDEVWLAVKREINGQTVRHVERIAGDFVSGDLADAFYLDDALTYEGAAATGMTGWGHLEGEEVAILADGGVHQNKTVESGGFTLDRAASTVHAGYNYNSDVRLLPADLPYRDGVHWGRLRRVVKILVEVYETVGLKAGPSADKLVDVPLYNSTMTTGEAVPLYSGPLDIQALHQWTKRDMPLLRQDRPLPCTIIAVIREVEAGG